MEAVGRHIKHYIHLHSYTINYGPTMYYANTLSHLQQQIHEQHTSLVTGGAVSYTHLTLPTTASV